VVKGCLAVQPMDCLAGGELACGQIEALGDAKSRVALWKAAGGSNTTTDSNAWKLEW
jgi:hypothetical protein